MERIGNKVSYIKKPYSKYGFVALGLSAASLILSAGAVYLGYYTMGNAPLSAGALGFSSMLSAAVGVAYGFFSCLEKEKNRLFGKISLTVSGVILLIWLVMIIIAL